MMIFSLLILIIVSGLCLLLYYRFNYLLNIRSVTIQLKKPEVRDEQVFRTTENSNYVWLINAEEHLRRLAYKSSSLNINDSFYNDMDMQGNYYLVVIYHRKTKTPLLSARYYFDKAVIKQYVMGAGESGINLLEFERGFSIENYKEGELFLADRLSGNTGSLLYRRYRNYIFMLFYARIYAKNQHSWFILMARKEPKDKLLRKYLALGLKVVGTKPHNGINHYVLLGDLKNGYSSLKLNGLFTLLMALKIKVIKLQRS